MSEEGFVAIATRLGFVGKVSVQILHVLSVYDFVAIAKRLEFLWFHCNCSKSWLSVEVFIVIGTRLEFLKEVSLQLLHVLNF